MIGGTVREGSNVDIRCRPHHTWLVAAFGELSMFIRGESKLYGTRTLWVTLGKPAERVVAYRCDGLRISTNFVVNFIVYLPLEKKPSERQRRWQSVTL